MTRLNNTIILLLLIILIFSIGCTNRDAQNEYNKCTSVCASVLEEDFVTMKLCVDECKDKFPDKNN